MSNEVVRFHPGILHWLTVALVLPMLAVGSLLFSHDMGDLDERRAVLVAHMVAGVLIGAVVLLRLWLRIRAARRAGQPWFTVPALVLYLLLVALVLSGFGMAVMSGINIAAFGGDRSQLAANWPDLAILEWHGILAWVLAAMVLLHLIPKILAWKNNR